MSEAKSVSGFKPRSQATIVETLWALAEAGAMLSMDPKISKPVLKKLTSRKNCGVKYSIPIKSINRSNSHDSPSKRLPWGRGRAKNRSPPRFGPVFDSFCLVSQFEASWLYILEFETLRTLTAFHRKQSLPKRNNGAGGGGRYGGCCQPDSFWDLLILRVDIAFPFASCCSVRFSLDIDRCNYCVAVA
jgi:hypothetical protein